MSVDDVKAVIRRASDYVNEINRKDQRIAELEAERDRLRDDAAKYLISIAELESELSAYKKDNAYLIEQLPIQKHQKYIEGLEAAAQDAEKNINEYADTSWNGACIEIAIAIRALKEES